MRLAGCSLPVAEENQAPCTEKEKQAPACMVKLIDGGVQVPPSPQPPERNRRQQTFVSLTPTSTLATLRRFWPGHLTKKVVAQDRE